MGMEYARLYFDFFTSEKTQYLIDECGDSGAMCLMRLWVRAGQRNNDGVFDKSSRALEKIAGWKGEEGKLIKVLTDPDFTLLDKISDDEYQLHNWDKNNPHLGEKAIERRSERARKAGLASAKKRKEGATTSQLQVNTKSTHSQLNSTKVQLGSTNVTKGKVTKGKVIKEPSSANAPFTREVLDYLNTKLGKENGKGYRTTSSKNQSLIKARIKEGYTVNDFKTVIDKKYKQWYNDPTMVEYLRPETLFGNKFESYLNQIGIKQEPERPRGREIR